MATSQTETLTERPESEPAYPGAGDEETRDDLTPPEITGDFDSRLVPPPRTMQRVKVKLKFAGGSAPRIPVDLESDWTLTLWTKKRGNA
jgi:hypothetical protein